MPFERKPIGAYTGTYPSSLFPSFNASQNSKFQFWDSERDIWQNTVYEQRLNRVSHIGVGSEFTVELYRVEPEDGAGKKPGTASVAPELIAMKTPKLPDTEGALTRLIQEQRILTLPVVASNDHVIAFKGALWKSENALNGEAIPRLLIEYAPFGDLANYFQQSPPLRLTQKVRLIHNILDGLEAVHLCNICHGDIKLSNILVFPNENYTELVAKISDFGLSIAPLTRTGSLSTGNYLGTERYKPPEATREVRMSIEELQKCDVFASGLVCWEILQDGVPYFCEHPEDCNTDLEDTSTSWLPDQYLERVGILFSRLKSSTRLSHPSQSTDSAAIASLQSIVVSMLEPQNNMRCTGREALDLIVAILAILHMDVQKIEIPKSVVSTRLDEGMPLVWKFSAANLGLPYRVQVSHFSTLKRLCRSLRGDEQQHAHVLLSYMYAHGYGTPVEHAKCIEHLQKASELGSVSAQFIFTRVKDAIETSHQLPRIEESESATLELRFLEIEEELNSVRPQDNFILRLQLGHKSSTRKVLEGPITFITPTRDLHISTPLNPSVLIKIINGNKIDPRQCLLSTDEKLPRLRLLHFIIRMGWLDVLKSIREDYPDFLVNQSASDWYNTRGMIEPTADPITIASFWGHESMISYLMECGFQGTGKRGQIGDCVPIVSINPLMLLHTFPLDRMVDVAKMFFKNGADPNADASMSWIQHFDGFPFPLDVPPLSMAIMIRNIRGVRVLLQLGADPLKEVGVGMLTKHTALELAISLHLYDVVQVLITHIKQKRPQDLSIHIPGTLVAFTGYVIGGRDQLLRWLLHGSDYQRACKETLRICMDLGARLNDYTLTGSTPLLYACCFHPCQKYIIETLLEAGSDPNLQNKNGQPPLQCCMNNWAPPEDIHAILKILIASGANVDLIHEAHSSCSTGVAASFDLTDSLSLLIDRGASISHLDKHGQQPILLALQRGSMESFNILLQKVSENYLSKSISLKELCRFQNLGRLIHNAVDSNIRIRNIELRKKAISGLQGVGVSLDVRDKSDPKRPYARTALAITIEEGNLELATYLLSLSASPFCRYDKSLKLWCYLNEFLLHSRSKEEDEAISQLQTLLRRTSDVIDEHNLLAIHNWMGLTLVQFAIFIGNVPIIKLLVEAGSVLCTEAIAPREYAYLEFEGLHSLEIGYALATYDPLDREKLIHGLKEVSNKKIEVVVEYLESVWAEIGVPLRLQRTQMKSSMKLSSMKLVKRGYKWGLRADGKNIKVLSDVW